ncbi:MAG: prephenate dehydrogenase/arogenate dehydrogenase family protein [Candidatus Melainabacteria bacterium]|nr:prephenate dehydrogenase/arogenate dehydrogenase family protein [Candidatus Melainabacteria bacterium]
MNLDFSPCPFQQLTVVGLGMIGGSVAMAARERWPDLVIRAVDSNAEALQFGLRHDIVNQVQLGELPTDWGDDASGEHLVVLASHLSVNEVTLQALAPRVQGRAVVVTDLGSCKRRIVELGDRLLPGQFIGAHPMAGKEKAGIDHATALMFTGKTFIVCPTPANQQAPALERLKLFIQGLGARPTELDATIHDQYMAYVSHLPQLYSILLTNLIAKHEPARLLTYHGGGIDDQLRLAASPYGMWGDIFSQNADHLRQVLDEMMQLLQQARQDLDQPEMAQWFQTANHMHQAFHALRQPVHLVP